MKPLFLLWIALTAFAADGVYTDKQHALMWQDNADAAHLDMNWHNATDYCDHLKLAGHTDWRLPTVQELVTLVDYTRESPAAVPALHNISTDDYWSATTDVTDSDDAWLVFFESGIVDNYSKSRERRVRCVRGLK